MSPDLEHAKRYLEKYLHRHEVAGGIEWFKVHELGRDHWVVLVVVQSGSYLREDVRKLVQKNQPPGVTVSGPVFLDAPADLTDQQVRGLL